MTKPKKFTITMIAMLLAVALVFPAPTATLADSGVALNVRPGLGGIFKVDQPLELFITVDNPGAELRGVVTVRVLEEEFHKGYRPDIAPFTMEVRVPAGGREVYSMVIPGELAAQRPGVELVSGGLVLARSRVEGAAISGNRVILALSEGIMGNSGLQAWLANTPGPQNTIKFVATSELPQDPILLGTADIIMVDPGVVPALTRDQGQVLQEWTQLGGTLILFGGAGAGKGEIFSGISPVLVTGKKNIDGRLSGLREGGPMTVATGELQSGRILARDGSSPVLARRNLGRGEVVFCGAVPVELGTGASGVWASLFGNVAGLEKVIHMPGIVAYRDTFSARDALVDASSYIPQLAGPPVLLLVLFWVLYAAVAGPVLYFFLRRADRRDLAWLLVPLGAVTAAALFYFLAPANRLQGHFTQTLATVEVFSPELAEVRAGAAVVAPRGGDFTVGALRGFHLVPTRPERSGKVPLVEQVDSGFKVKYSNVEYGSMRRVYAYGLQRDFGSIQGNLLIEGNSIKGELTNKTGLNLRDCSLLLGSRAFRMGTLPAGGVVNIDEVLDDWALVANPIESLIGGQFVDHRNDPFFRARRMIMRFNHFTDFGNGMGVDIVGWHDGSPGLIQVLGNRARGADHGIVQFKQRVSIDLAGGKFTLPAGFIKPRQVESEKAVMYSHEVKEIHPGAFNLLYDLGDAGIAGNIRIESIVFRFSPGQVPYKAELYSPARDRWEPLTEGNTRINSNDLSNYLIQNRILVKMTPAGDVAGPQPAWPGLIVEGVVTG